MEEVGRGVNMEYSTADRWVGLLYPSVLKSRSELISLNNIAY